MKPGRIFKGFFYWDAYFILLGLIVHGRWQLAREIVDNMIIAIEAYGMVPNYIGGDRVCRSRSQPPFLISAIRVVALYIGDEPLKV